MKKHIDWKRILLVLLGIALVSGTAHLIYWLWNKNALEIGESLPVIGAYWFSLLAYAILACAVYLIYLIFDVVWPSIKNFFYHNGDEK